MSMVKENYPVVSLLPPPFHRHPLHGQPLPLSLLLFLPLSLVVPFSILFVFLLLLFHHEPGDFLQDNETSHTSGADMILSVGDTFWKHPVYIQCDVTNTEVGFFF